MNKTVADIMTPSPITVNPDTPLKDAITILAQKKLSGLPVVDKDNKLVGVISETDLMWQETGVEPPPYIMILDSVIYLQNPNRYEKDIHKALGQTVGEVMTNKPITIKSDDSVKRAAQILHEKKISRLPVVDADGNVVGIVTQGDIIQAMALDS
ncbi:CBS domain-containing protein [Cyanobacterium stanieri LEGE 03274]|uniref:CBS domain-containing protein n=1 Tax=Cyanobacterium stanieri LEGE 03274 TaxID=1828756 RepID=A0ABR9V3V3_9CHRO|nr:CBS domain-containing protein [Cyanobacterium stanieri]MBE9222517.1 CBS domain-containing protein [Cyanobacterium stanieri LEGE 03274]